MFEHDNYMYDWFDADSFWDIAKMLALIALGCGFIWFGYHTRAGIKATADQSEQIERYFDGSGARFTGLRQTQRVVGTGEDEEVERVVVVDIVNETKAAITSVSGKCKYIDGNGREVLAKEMTFYSDAYSEIPAQTSGSLVVEAKERVDGSFYDRRDLSGMRCEIMPYFKLEDRARAIGYKAAR